MAAYAHLGHRREDFPCASAYQNEILSLPIYPELSPAQIDHVCDRLIDLLSSQAPRRAQSSGLLGRARNGRWSQAAFD